ncbi:fungal specific transcription factor [Colletotrichum tofieldiae]|nr:fungal specific transcription factor [Colletotrichum tofieldiae]GKT71304.1 fungal specific transcription factor [Colletotrichum tofieldiae]
MSDESSSQLGDTNPVGMASTSTPEAQRSSHLEATDTPSSAPSPPPTAARESNGGPVIRSRVGSGNGGPGRKIERSCQLCHRRKIRCDKKQPCSSCVRGGFQCYYPPIGQPVRRVRKTTIADVASRISDLEKTLVAGASQQHQAAFRPSPTPGSTSGFISDHCMVANPRPLTEPASGPHGKVVGDEVLVRKGASSQYFDEVLISRVIEEEHDIQSVLTTPVSEPAPQAAPSPFNPMGILSALDLNQNLADLLPPKSGAIELWRNYVDNIEVCNKVLHRPTAEILIYTAIDDPDNAPPDAMAVMFAVFFVSTVILEPSTVQRLIGDDKMTCLHRFKTGLEQAFAKADFLEHPSVKLLEAFAVYMAALRIHNPGRGLWTLNGLAIRAAQSIGLHRDGTMLGLSPFESEIRRRIWWHLLGRDGRAGEDYGIQNPTSFNLHAGVSFPSNLEDSDLYPEMEGLPPPRRGWTQLTIGLINIQGARTWHRLSAMASSWSDRPTPESVRAQIVQELRDYAEGFLRHCNPVVPQQRQTVLVSNFIIRKIDLVTRQQWLHLEHPEARESFATEENLEEALGILDAGMSLASDELLRPYRWSMGAYPQYHMLLYVLWHLCVKPEGPSVERAWATIDENLGLIKSVGAGVGPAAKMTILDALRSKALTVRQGLAQQKGGGGNEQGDGGDGGGSVEVDGDAYKEVYPTPGGTEEMVLAGRPEDVLDGMDWSTGMQDLPDWSTLMNEFQMDGLNFPNYIN